MLLRAYLAPGEQNPKKSGRPSWWSITDHPAADYSRNQYITRDDVHTDPVTMYLVMTYLGHNLLHPRGTIARVHHQDGISHIYETHMD